jgi:hypothetical protein
LKYVDSFLNVDEQEGSFFSELANHVSTVVLWSFLSLLKDTAVESCGAKRRI